MYRGVYKGVYREVYRRYIVECIGECIECIYIMSDYDFEKLFKLMPYPSVLMYKSDC